MLPLMIIRHPWGSHCVADSVRQACRHAVQRAHNTTEPKERRSEPQPDPLFIYCF